MNEDPIMLLIQDAIDYANRINGKITLSVKESRPLSSYQAQANQPYEISLLVDGERMMSVCRQRISEGDIPFVRAEFMRSLLTKAIAHSYSLHVQLKREEASMMASMDKPNNLGGLIP